MKKLMKTANVLDILAKIALILAIVQAVVLAVALILLAFDVTAFSYSLTLDHFEFALASCNPALVNELFVWTVVLGFISLAATILAILVVRRILAPMKEGKPFSTSIAGYLSQLSWIVLGGGILGTAVEYFSKLKVYRLFDLSTLFLNENILGCTFQYSADYTFVLIFAILMMLSCVFRYGEQLQQQSDETL